MVQHEQLQHYRGKHDVLTPKRALTRRTVADYYTRVAPFMLPLVARRPLTLVRCIDGQETPTFFQKQARQGLAASIGRLPSPEDEGELVYPYVRTAAGLGALAQMGTHEIHMWGSRVDALDRPDTLVFDLDPGPGVAWCDVVEAARTMQLLLGALGLRSFVMTTGGKGLHVSTPILPTVGREEALLFARVLATALECADPSLFVASRSSAKREQRVFVDYLRNVRGAAAIAPYSTRVRADRYVAMPVSWKELGTIVPATFTVESAPIWLARRGDPWAELPSVRQALTPALMRKVGA